MKNNQTKDYDDDISFNVVNPEYSKYVAPPIEYLRDTNQINNEDKEILKQIHEQKEHEIEQNSLNELNDLTNINQQHLLSTNAVLDALNQDTIRYSLQTQDIKSNQHYAVPFISLLFLFGLAVWLIITAPTLPPAAVPVGKYFVFSPERTKMKIDNNVINNANTNQNSKDKKSDEKIPDKSSENKSEAKHNKKQ
ncbi:MAG: hypothetical protein RLZZ210_1780 [Pseudomonadota bacterium]|jgi:hypothetical protein